jgi:hypothetical protein
MSRFYSLALHDLRVSEGRSAILTIELLQKYFQIPITIHLILDTDLDAQPELMTYLQNQVHVGNLEIVFHGLKHTCSKKVSRLGAFFHKYQAEYLESDAGHLEATQLSFRAFENKMKMQIGLCPPCWLASRKNMVFFRSLRPLYIETMMYLRNQEQKVISPVISLGSPNKFETLILKMLAGAIYLLAAIFSMHRVRIAVHVCDLNSDTALCFFGNLISKFNRRNFKPVLLRNFIKK